jgi:hypothetical protein
MSSIFIEYPHCQMVESYKFNPGYCQFRCTICLKPFNAEMLCVPVYEANKTTIVLSASVEQIKERVIERMAA